MKIINTCMFINFKRLSTTINDSPNKVSILDENLTSEHLIIRGLVGGNGVNLSLVEADPDSSNTEKVIVISSTGGSSVDLTNIPNGSISNPSIAFQSSQTTGIYSPSVNSISIVNNNESVLRIDNQNNVLIDTSTSLKLPVGNLLERPTPQDGMVRLNTTLDNLELYNNGWKIVPSTDLPVLPNTVLTWSGTDFQWTSLGSATQTDIVDSITERDLLTPVLGKYAYVRDYNGSNNWALYLCIATSPTQWTLIASEFSSNSNSDTYSININVTDTSPRVITTLPATGNIVKCIVNVITAFDDLSAELSVGDSVIQDQIMLVDQNDLSIPGIYETNINISYGTDENIITYFNFGSSTTGQLTVSIVIT